MTDIDIKVTAGVNSADGSQTPVTKKLRDMGDGTYAEVVALAADPSIDIGDVQLLAGTALIGKVGLDQTTPGTTNAVAPIAGQNGVAGGAGAVGATVQRITLASDDPAVVTLGATADAVVAAGAVGSISAKLRAISRDIVANIVLAAGTAILGKVGTDRTTPGTTNSVAPISGQDGVAAGAGAVSALTQRVTLASDDLAVSVLGATSGAKVITDANATIQQYLRGLISQWISSTLTFASQGLGSQVTLTRTNDTNVYTANDVVGSATGSTAALTFPVAATGENLITSISLEIDEAAVITGEVGYRLHLYNIAPPSALGDNAAWDLPSGDRASYLGFVDFGQPVDLGSTCYIETNGVNKQITSLSGNIFGYLVTIGAYTPTASLVYKPYIHTVKV